MGGGFEVHPWFRLCGKWTVRYTPATRFGIGTLSGRDTLLNDYLPKIDVDPDTCTVKADGRELRCEPASVLPMAQQFFCFKNL